MLGLSFLLVAAEAVALQDGVWEPSTVEGWEARHRANVQMGKALIDRVRGSDIATTGTNAVVDGLRTVDDASAAAGMTASRAGPYLHWVGKGAEGVDLLAKLIKVADAYNKDGGKNSRAAITTAGIETAKWLAGNYAGGAAAAFVASKAVAWKAAAAGTTTVGLSVIAPAVVAGFATTLLVETMIDPPDLYAAKREEFERLVSSWPKDPAGQTMSDNQGRFVEQLRPPALQIPHLAPDARTVPPADWARIERAMPPAKPVPLQSWPGTDTGSAGVAADTAGLAVVQPRGDTSDPGADLRDDVPQDSRARERRRRVDRAAAGDSPASEERAGAGTDADLDQESETASIEPTRDEPAPVATGPLSPVAAPAVDILKYVKPQTATASARRVENLGAGGVGNSLVTEAVLTFWNVGSLVDGHGRAEMKVRSVMTMTGQGDTHVLRGTFSGGPRGTFVFESPDGPTRFRLSDGKTAVTDGLTFTLSNPEVFKGWPRELQ